ncbi:MAG: sirohydrochlorin cobaltochelatase [Victivallales bacterium]|jgi:sirohydrochlorin cobaltochelatase
MKHKTLFVRTSLLVLVASVLMTGINLYAADKKAILLAAFGTSYSKARQSYDNIEKTIKKENPGAPVYWAFTSNKVRAILKKRGVKTMSVPEALAKMRADGITEAVVQSLHVVPGLEYNRKILSKLNDFQKGKNPFAKLDLGKPMLFSAQSLDDFCEAMFAIIPKGHKKGDAILLMGHNNPLGGTDLFYIAAGLALNKQDPNIFVATIEGKPDFQDAVKELEKNKVRKVYLMPMMVVAGDHANNDLAGDEADSWKSQLEKRGFTCVPVLKGLGEYNEFAEIYAKHLKAAMKDGGK